MLAFGFANLAENISAVSLIAQPICCLECCLTASLEAVLNVELKAKLSARFSASLEDRFNARLEARFNARFKCSLKARCKCSLKARCKCSLKALVQVQPQRLPCRHPLYSQPACRKRAGTLSKVETVASGR